MPVVFPILVSISDCALQHQVQQVPPAFALPFESFNSAALPYLPDLCASLRECELVIAARAVARQRLNDIVRYLRDAEDFIAARINAADQFDCDSNHSFLLRGLGFDGSVINSRATLGIESARN